MANIIIEESDFGNLQEQKDFLIKLRTRPQPITLSESDHEMLNTIANSIHAIKLIFFNMQHSQKS